MRRAATVLTLLATLSACPRRHEPPDWQPSIHPPGLAQGSPPGARAVTAPAAPAIARWSPPPPPAPALPPSPPASPPGALVELREGRDGGTVNGDPRGPRAEELEAVVRGAAPALQRCVEAGPLPTGVDVPIRVGYRILPMGRTGTVEVEGQVPPDVVVCVKAVFDGLRFPRFEGEPISSVLPFRFRKELVPAQQPTL